MSREGPPNPIPVPKGYHESVVKPIVLQNYINGKWQEGSGEKFRSVNPAHLTEVLAEGNEATSGDVLSAVVAADVAYDKWRLTPPPKREEYFYRLLVKLGDPEDLGNEVIKELASLVSRECGKTLNEARADVVEGIHMIRVCAARGREPIGENIPSEFAEKLCYTERDPRGVTAVISPWNFPFAIPWWNIGPALMMGNTVVFKPAEQTALVGQRIVELCNEVGFPPGVINLVHGGAATGESLVRNPLVRSVLFTGSYEVGRKIKLACAEDDELDKLAVLETGSKSALIIFDDAGLLLASDATMKSAFKTTGQRCVSAGRVFVPRNMVSSFADRLMQDIEGNVREGDPLDPGTFMGPLIDQQGAGKVSLYNELVRIAARQSRKGITILMDGGEISTAPGYFAKPFVYVVHQYSAGLRPLREEVFGPHLAIIAIDDLDEAVRYYEDAPYSLALSLITPSMRWRKVAREVRHKGMVYVNGPTIGAEVQLPFGGTRRSGTGMSSAAYMFDNVSHPVAYTVNTADTIRLAQGLT